MSVFLAFIFIIVSTVAFKQDVTMVDGATIVLVAMILEAVEEKEKS